MATIDFKRLETLSKTYDGVLQVKKTVASVDDLPNTGVTVGDVYMVGEENPTPYMWNGENFAPFGGVSKKYVDDQLNGYTDLVPVTGRKLTGDEASLLEINEPDSYIAIENPAESGEKKLILRYPVDDGRFDNTERSVFWYTEGYRLTTLSGNAVDPVSCNANVVGGGIIIPLNTNAKNNVGLFNGLNDYAEIVIPDNSLFVFHTGVVVSMGPTNYSMEYLQDNGSIEITEEIEHGRVLREEDVATAEKEANLLGFIELNSTVKGYMLVRSGEDLSLGFNEYTAYMQNYGPLSVYPAAMASAETIDGLLVNESTVEAGSGFIRYVKGYALNSHTDYYTVETEQETTIYPDKFNCFPSLVCIGKTGDEERWVCVNIPNAANFSNYEVYLGSQAYAKHLAVYDAKPKLTQVAASVYAQTWA